MTFRLRHIGIECVWRPRAPPDPLRELTALPRPLVGLRGGNHVMGREGKERGGKKGSGGEVKRGKERNILHTFKIKLRPVCNLTFFVFFKLFFVSLILIFIFLFCWCGMGLTLQNTNNF